MAEDGARTFRSIIAVDDISDVRHVSRRNPSKMGNTADIAYGGCVLSLSISAAVRSVPASFFCYSAQGLYLGPTLASDKVTLTTTRVRDTKSFKTVRVEATQAQKGAVRMTFYLTADFQVKEAPVLRYNVQPRMRHPPAEACRYWPQELADRAASGELPAGVVKAYLRNFKLMADTFEVRHCPESVARQNVSGLHATPKLTRPDATMLEKTTAYWFRCTTELTHAESYAAIGFVTDAALAFVPVTFRNEFITAYGPISSLDCSLRFHTSDFSCNDWLLHEQVAEAADDGRTYSTGRVFRPDGVLVATMSQMSIMRAKPGKSTAPNL